MPHPNYLALFRQRWALSKQELARLLGYQSRNPVARCEKTCEREPTIKLALGCEVVFGQTPSELFPGLYAEIEDAVMQEATALDRAVRGKTDEASEKKRQLLLEDGRTRGSAANAK